MQINVNTAALSHYTRQLEGIRKSALPSAVRNTLNSAAFDVKGKSMPKVAKATFTQRKPNFFKANSRVEPANGGSIPALKATVGFIPKDAAVKELEQQERGGIIGGRSFITEPEARVGKSWAKSVTAKNRITALDNVINAEKVRVTANNRNKNLTKKQKFIRAAIMAKKLHGNNALVLGNSVGGVQTLSRINRIAKTNNGGLNIKRTPLYTYRKDRKVRIKSTNFMKRASLESGMKLERWFITHAEKAINSVK